MPPKIEAPSFDALVAEQEVVQAGKFQGRLLDEYNQYIFPGQIWLEPRSSAVSDFLRPLCSEDRVSLDGVLQGIYSANGGRAVRWVDMGGGRGLAMRQLACRQEVRSSVTMTNVDIIDFGLNGLQPDQEEYLENLNPGITDERVAPQFIQDNAETVMLFEPADVVTSVEAMQYLDNPLAAISNWYNQLADHGLMIVSTEHDWASWVRYDRGPGQGDRDETPTKHLLDVLSKARVRHAASYENDWESGIRPLLDPGCFRNLVIQKMPGSQMVLNAAVTEIWLNPYNYKAAYYEEPKPGAPPLIEILTT